MSLQSPSGIWPSHVLVLLEKFTDSQPTPFRPMPQPDGDMWGYLSLGLCVASVYHEDSRDLADHSKTHTGMACGVLQACPSFSFYP